MNLTITGHDDRYAVEQLMLSLFPEDTRAQAESTLHRGSVYLTASARITLDGKTARACRRLRADRETVRLRRQALQQSLYLAAIQLLPELPPWGALAGVRPTKITTRHLLEGGTHVSADRLLRDVYYVTPDRRKLSVDCSQSTGAAAGLMSAVCGHPLLPHPVQLLQLCQPHGGEEDGAAGALPPGPSGGNPLHREAACRLRQNRAHPLHRRRNPYHPFF